MQGEKINSNGGLRSHGSGNIRRTQFEPIENNHFLYFEAKTFLHGLLVVEDKLRMAYGLETRVPFFDNDLVDFSLRLPVGLKLGNLAEVVRLNENESGRKTEPYYGRTKGGKLLLRRVLNAPIPESAAWQAKQGFSAPDPPGSEGKH